MAIPVVSTRFLSLFHQPPSTARGLRAIEGEREGDALERTYWQTLREVLPLMRAEPARRRRGAA